MIIKSQQLVGLLVRTKSKEVLGQIKDFELDVDSGQVVNYIVSSSHLVKKILADDLLIGPDQIISISREEMVVTDGMVTQQSSIKELVST